MSRHEERLKSGDEMQTPILPYSRRGGAFEWHSVWGFPPLTLVIGAFDASRYCTKFNFVVQYQTIEFELLPDSPHRELYSYVMPYLRIHATPLWCLGMVCRVNFGSYNAERYDSMVYFGGRIDGSYFRQFEY